MVWHAMRCSRSAHIHHDDHKHCMRHSCIVAAYSTGDAFGDALGWEACGFVAVYPPISHFCSMDSCVPAADVGDGTYLLGTYLPEHAHGACLQAPPAQVNRRASRLPVCRMHVYLWAGVDACPGTITALHMHRPRPGGNPVIWPLHRQSTPCNHNYGNVQASSGTQYAGLPCVQLLQLGSVVVGNNSCLCGTCWA